MTVTAGHTPALVATWPFPGDACGLPPWRPRWLVQMGGWASVFLEGPGTSKGVSLHVCPCWLRTPPRPQRAVTVGPGGQGLRCLQSLRGRWLPTSRAVAPARPLRGVSGSCFEGPSCRRRGPNAAGTPRQSEEQLLSCRGSRPPRATPARASHPSGPRPCSCGHGDSAKATSAQGRHCPSCHVLTLQQPGAKCRERLGPPWRRTPHPLPAGRRVALPWGWAGGALCRREKGALRVMGGRRGWGPGTFQTHLFVCLSFLIKLQLAGQTAVAKGLMMFPPGSPSTVLGEAPWQMAPGALHALVSQPLARPRCRDFSHRPGRRKV